MNIEKCSVSTDYIEIPLTRGYVAIVDLIDAELAEITWYARVSHGLAYAEFHAKCLEKKVYVPLHRIVLERALGRLLSNGELTDHIDGNSLNNRRCNLRPASFSQNNQNAKLRCDNKTGFKGVDFIPRENRYRASIRVDGKQIDLGRFKTPELAYAMYCEAAYKHFGEFARIK